MSATLDLVGPREIADRIGVESHTVTTWAARYATFPAPLFRVSKVPVYSWAAVRAWLISTDRLAADIAGNREVAAMRATILAEIARALDVDDVDTLLAEPVYFPRTAAAFGREQLHATAGAGELDWLRDTTAAERTRIAAHAAWTHPRGVRVDVRADQLTLDVDTFGAAWLRATRLVGMADVLRRRCLPRTWDAFGGWGPSDLWPDLAERFGPLESIFAPGAGAAVAAAGERESGADIARPPVATHGPDPIALDYEAWLAEVDELAPVVAVIEQAADEWPSAADLDVLARWRELLPEGVEYAGTPEDVYVAVVRAYLAALV